MATGPSPAVDLGQLRSALGLPVEASVILSVGPLVRHQGIKNALWALDILKYLYEDLFLLVVGDGPEREVLERFARNIGVTHQVRFLGWRDDIPELYQVAEIVWVPSLRDDYPLTVLEALKAAKPVVASRLPGIDGIIQDGRTGLLVAPGDKPALARQTRVLLENPALGRRLGAAGREHAAQAFAAKLLVEHHLDPLPPDHSPSRPRRRKAG